MDFSMRLRQIRRSKGISQSVLAEKLGLTKQAISNYESGANAPTHSMLLRIADFMEADLDYLTGRVDEKSAALMEKIRRLSPDGIEEVTRFADAVMEKEASYGKKD